MEYNNFYHDTEDPFSEPPKKSKARVFLSILAGLLACAVVAVLVMGILRSGSWSPGQGVAPGQSWPPVTQDPSEGEYGPEEPANTPQPTATPFATERPMISLDGVAPVLPETGNPIPELVEAAVPSVVGVLNYAERSLYGGSTSRDDRLQGMGSGFIVSSAGYIITNAHVVSDAYEVDVALHDGTEIAAEVIGMDMESDVAVLKISYPGLQALKIGSSDDIRVGEYVLAIGTPLGWLDGSVTMGIISARSRAVPIDGRTNLYIQTDAAINIGNSGGPLLNMQGEVIGVNTAKSITAGYDETTGTAISAEGLGFALPIQKVMSIATQLITKGYVQRAALGVQIVSLTSNELKELGLQNGIRVESVMAGSPAETAGILAGDIIIACDGVRYDDQNELVEYINMQALGAQVEMELWRDGKELTIEVVLIDKSDIDYNSSAPADDGQEEEDDPYSDFWDFDW